MKLKLSKILKVLNGLSKVLNKDIEFRYKFRKAITEAYIDCERQYRSRTNKRYLNLNDKHIIGQHVAQVIINKIR